MILSEKQVKTVAVTTYYLRMTLLKRNKAAAATIAKVCQRREKLVKRFNAGNWRKYWKMFAVDAVLCDPDLHRITGTQKLGEYFKILFEFAKEHGFPPIKLKSKRMLMKGEFIYDIGEYVWSTLRRGRYLHKWALIKGEYYLVSDRFTVEKSLMNDGNVDNSL